MPDADIGKNHDADLRKHIENEVVNLFTEKVVEKKLVEIVKMVAQRQVKSLPEIVLSRFITSKKVCEKWFQLIYHVQKGL